MNVYPRPGRMQIDAVTETRARISNAIDRRTRVPEECQAAWLEYANACAAAGVKVPTDWRHWPRTGDSPSPTHLRDRIDTTPQSPGESRRQRRERAAQ